MEFKAKDSIEVKELYNKLHDETSKFVSDNDSYTFTISINFDKNVVNLEVYRKNGYTKDC